MKELLNAIKAQLQDDLSYIRDADIYVTPHENYIPNQVRPPCVGLKDGPVTRTMMDRGGSWETRLEVKIVCYVQLAKDEASVMGDTGTGKKGVLDIIDDINASLDNDTLSISGMKEATLASESESEMFGDEKEGLQRKIVTYLYTREDERP